MGRSLSLISLNKFVQLIGGALWAAIVPRWLGPEDYGRFALAMSISLLLWWVGDFGGLEVFGRFLPGLDERDPRAARRLFGQMFLLRCLVGLSLVPFMLVVGPRIAPWLTGWPAALVGLSAGLHIISWTSYHTLYARKEMGKWAVELSWRLITQLPLVLAVGQWGLTAQMAAYTVNELIYLALGLWWTRRDLAGAEWRPAWRSLWPYLAVGLGFWATNAGLIVLFRVGTTLVQVFTGDAAEVSYYDLALVVFFLVYTIVDQLIRAFLPMVSTFKEEGQDERVGAWLQIVAQWSAALGVLFVVVVYYTAAWIMPFVLGAAYGRAAVVLQVMLLALPALALVSVGTVATAVRASARAKLIAILGGIVAFLGSSPWLIARFQAVGAAGALALGLMVYAVILFAFIRHDLRLRWSALAGLMALALPLLAARPLIGDRFDLAVAASLVAVVAYVGLALGLRLLSPAPLRLVPRLLRKDDGR